MTVVVRLAGWVVRTVVYTRALERSLDRAVVKALATNRMHVP